VIDWDATSGVAKTASRQRTRLGTLIVAILVGGLTLTAAPENGRAESLEEALVQTYSENPTIRAARARLRGVNERVPQERANWRPDVTVSGSAGRQRLREEQPGFGGGTTTTTDYTNPITAQARIRQPLFRGGRTIAGVDRAENEVRAQRAELTNTQQEVLLRAIEAYLNVWRDRRILQLARDNVETLAEQLEATQARLDQGIVTRTDLAQARSRLSQARARRETAQGELTASEAAYREVIGGPPGEVSYPGVPETLPASEAAAVEQAVRDNPRVVAAEFRRAAADNRVRQTEGELLPTAFLEGSLSHQENQSGPDREVQRAQITLNLQIPLYQSGEVTSRVREAKQQASERRIQIAEARKRARQQAASAWARLQAARAERREIEQQVDAAGDALTGVQEELRVGARSVLDVLDAEQELFNARVQRVRARRDLAVAAYRVYSATGQLTARGLKLPTSYYNPKAAYDEVSDVWWQLSAPEAEPRSEGGAGSTEE
jgi:TolC family type I secretion outer membrane protein